MKVGKVGCVMPTWNQNKFIKAALASWDAQVCAPERTLVVVDDGCTDGTTALGRIVVKHPRNLGTAEAINTGIRVLTQLPPEKGEAFRACASGPIPDALTWISSDNEMSPNWLDVLSRAMEDHQAGMTYGGFDYVKGGRSAYHFKSYDPTRLVADVNCYVGPAFLVRRDVWLEAGPHRGRISHDYDHNLRIEEVCWRRGLSIVGVDESLCRYDAHDERVTVTRADQFDAYRWRDEALARRKVAVK